MARLVSSSQMVDPRGDFREAVISVVDLHPGRLFYFAHQGTLVREANNPLNDIAAGIVLSGHACLRGPGFGQLAAGEGVIQLPGDAALQVSTDLEALAFRLPIASACELRLIATPFAANKSWQRVLPARSADELGSLLRFTAMEMDRLADEGRDRLDQGRALGLAIRQRLHDALPSQQRSLLEPRPIAEEICLNAYREIEASSSGRLTTTELADRARCSVRTLFRSFDQILGIGPAEFELRYRLRRLHIAATAQAFNSTIHLSPATFGFTSGETMQREYLAEFGEEIASTVRDRRASWQALVQAVSGDFAREIRISTSSTGSTSR